jgi:hypothetical protein
VLHRSALEVGVPLDGPCVVEEDGATTLVEPGMRIERTPQGSLLVATEAAR